MLTGNTLMYLAFSKLDITDSTQGRKTAECRSAISNQWSTSNRRFTSNLMRGTRRIVDRAVRRARVDPRSAVPRTACGACWESIGWTIQVIRLSACPETPEAYTKSVDNRERTMRIVMYQSDSDCVVLANDLSPLHPIWDTKQATIAQASAHAFEKFSPAPPTTHVSSTLPSVRKLCTASIASRK